MMSNFYWVLKLSHCGMQNCGATVLCCRLDIEILNSCIEILILLSGLVGCIPLDLSQLVGGICRDTSIDIRELNCYTFKCLAKQVLCIKQIGVYKRCFPNLHRYWWLLHFLNDKIVGFKYNRGDLPSDLLTTLGSYGGFNIEWSWQFIRKIGWLQVRGCPGALWIFFSCLQLFKHTVLT